MTKNKTIRLALDVLEKEMAVLSGPETFQILGGDGTIGDGPIPPTVGNYCTFNNTAFILQHYGFAGATAENVLSNYTSAHGIGEFTFKDGKVEGVSTANGSLTNQFLGNIFNSTTITNGSAGMRAACTRGNFINISKAGANGHAMTVTAFIEDASREGGGYFVIRDTTTNANVEVDNTETNLSAYVNPAEITGRKVGPETTSGGWWTSGTQSSVQEAPTSSGSTGTN